MNNTTPPTIPPVSSVQAALSELSPTEVRRLAVLCDMHDETVRRIASGRTENPGIETCRQLMARLADARRVRES